ncbi:hypothetical protein [Polynucleobacter sp. Adler-ghost]|uniref:hypothetical protein n=1 Tax=Polynucleobacter sp. Adler-ghost TaxID=2770234 RepID=UPI001BFE4245|nr:hypothetical protein [Polynucleobacter sp. Adler-ghost]QWE29910.1 hypothetical protein ICV89_06280 [Polynucleobacter sp. Adler-ghost]
MKNAEFDPSGPPLFVISSDDWWVKVLGMLQHNWALIDESNKGVTAYFFHDEGIAKGFPPGFTLSQMRNRCAIIDSIEFRTLDEAKEALSRNGFERLEENPGPWDDYQPHGNLYDARETEDRIYSKAGYWVK